MLKPKEYTILFTEHCQLGCLYCDQREQNVRENRPPTIPNLKDEEVLQIIDDIDTSIDRTIYQPILRITGGEPFLYPDLINKILDTYGNRFTFVFNTSGFNLTEDMLDKLSNYKVSFTLSTDGDEKLTNYLRPVKNKYKAGYFNYFKKIAPILLYYYPTTPFKCIINPRYIDLVYERQYLAAENLNFRIFSGILDFGARPSVTHPSSTAWSDDYTDLLRKEYQKITMRMLELFMSNLMPVRVLEIDKAIQFILANQTYSPETIPCQLFNGRENYMLRGFSIGKSGNHCMSKDFPNLGDFKDLIINEYTEKTKNMSDYEKGLFDYVMTMSCPKNSYDQNKTTIQFDPLEEAMFTVAYEAAYQILAIGLEECQNSIPYKKYIQSLGAGWKGKANSYECL